MLDGTVIAAIIAAVSGLGSAYLANHNRLKIRDAKELSEIAARKSLLIEEQLRQVNQAVNNRRPGEPPLVERVKSIQSENADLLKEKDREITQQREAIDRLSRRVEQQMRLLENLTEQKGKDAR